MKLLLMGAVAGGGVFPVRDRVEPQGDALVPGEERGEPERDHSAAVPAAERGDGALDAEGDVELIKLLYTLFIHSDEHLFPSSRRLTSSKALQSDVRMNSCPPQASGNEVELRESCDVAPGGRREGASRALQQHLAL